jgi:hypothetical protein
MTLDKCILAANEATDPAILVKLASDDDYNVRLNVAANYAAPFEVLNKLAVDKDWRVRIKVAHAISCFCTEFSLTFEHVRILVKLASDENKQVRAKVASSVYLPADCLLKLSTDVDLVTRCNVAFNDSTPREALEILLLDPEMCEVTIKALVFRFSHNKSNIKHVTLQAVIST